MWILDSHSNLQVDLHVAGMWEKQGEGRKSTAITFVPLITDLLRRPRINSDNNKLVIIINPDE